MTVPWFVEEEQATAKAKCGGSSRSTSSGSAFDKLTVRMTTDRQLQTFRPQKVGEVDD